MDVHPFQGTGENHFPLFLFQYDDAGTHRYESLSNEVRALCEDTEHNLWVGLKDGKIRIYDKNRTELGYFTETGTISHAGIPLKGNTYCIFQDSKHNIWIATKGEGLVKARPQGGGHYKLTRYCHSRDDIYSLSDNNVYCVYEDHHGRIWAATFAGGINYISQGRTWGRPSLSITGII